MVFPILGGNSVSAEQYLIDNSLRFNDDDSSRLLRTPSSTTNRRTWTYSAWVKPAKLSAEQYIWEAQNGTNFNRAGFNNTEIVIGAGTSGVAWTWNLYSDAKHRDSSAWYHVVYALDTTQSTASNRVKVYVNGSQITDWRIETYPSQNSDWGWNTTGQHNIGARNDSQYGLGGFFDGYLAEVYFVDGQQLSPTDFGEYDNNGIWKPLDSEDVTSAITFGTNGFYLDFENSGSLGADSSGNSNNFTPTNLTSTDQMPDTPTKNFCTLNGVRGAIGNYDNGTLSEGNLKFVTPNQSIFSQQEGTIFLTSGKWYWEVFFVSSGNDAGVLGIQRSGLDIGAYPGKTANGYGYDSYGSGLKIHNNSSSAYGSSYGANDIIGVALDLDNGTLTFYKNNSSQGQAFSGIDSSLGWSFSYGAGYLNTFVVNFGQDSSFAGNKTAQNNSDGNGEGDFFYAPPTGFLCLNSTNLATALSPTIDDGSAYFQTLTFTGNGSTQTLTFEGNSDLQADFMWFKERNLSANWHQLWDTSRGIGVASSKRLYSNASSAEENITSGAGVRGVGTDTVEVGSTAGINGSSQPMVLWGWKANGGTTSSNTDGSITSTVQANTTAGFSIVTYTGTGSNATVGHSLGVKPDMVIVKNRSASGRGWVVWHNALAGNEALELNTTDAKITSTTSWNSTVPTSSVFSVGTRVGTNESSQTFVAYCFAEIEGYSKFGSYEGNGSSTDNSFIYTGFQPEFVMLKNIDATFNWMMFDNTRDEAVINSLLEANTSDSERVDDKIDFLSNGFKIRSNSGENGGSYTYIYMAIARSPFVASTSIPVTAR